MWILLGTVYLASLLGSLHCVGMCGPFAVLASSCGDARQRGTTSSVLVSTAAYSLGRLVTYTLVGFLFGAIGLALNQGTSFAPWQQTATYFAGGLMIAVGFVALARHCGWNVRWPGVGNRVQDQLQILLQGLFRPVTRQPPVRRAFLIGALTCLMPCGWLYAFAIVAAGTGSPIWGAVVMAVFWSGTIPIMVALVLGFNRMGQAIQQRIPVAMAGLVIAVGVFTIVFRAPVAVGHDQNVVGTTEQLIEQVNQVDHSQLPCCAGK